MNRRALLGTGATAALGFLAGCTDDGTETPEDDGSSGSPSPSPTASSTEPTDESTGEPTETTRGGHGDDSTREPTEEPTDQSTPGRNGDGARLRDTSFGADEAECGSRRDEASVTTESGDGYRVLVTGTTSASNPCHAAELETADYDAESDELTLNVVTTETGDGACAQCIAEIDYEATATFENELPGSVVVEHDGETVATARP